jgi:hypothetical protein
VDAVADCDVNGLLVYPFEAHGIAASASGNLFLGGMNASTGHWLIKKY